MGALAGLFALGQVVILTEPEQRYAPLIMSEAQRQGVDPAFVMAVVWNESRFHPQAVGRDPGGTRSYGLMQVLLSTARLVARRPSLTADDLLDPALNVRLGVSYLRMQLDRYGGNYAAAYAAYNDGAARVNAQGQYVNTQGLPTVQAHVDQVLSRVDHYRQAWEEMMRVSQGTVYDPGGLTPTEPVPLPGGGFWIPGSPIAWGWVAGALAALLGAVWLLRRF